MTATARHPVGPEAPINHRGVTSKMTTIPLISEKTGEIKKGHYGVCWLYLFLGPLIPWKREGFGQALKHLAYGVLTLTAYFWIQLFSYNKTYTMRLLRAGWNFAGSDAENRLAAVALGVAYERVTESQIGNKFEG